MSREIDTRVVEMQFDNSQFESNAKTTLGTLDKLKNALDFSRKSSEVSDSVSNIQRSIERVDFSPFSNAIDSVQNRLSTLGIVGATVIHNITNEVITSARQILTAIPHQISEGGMARALNIEQAKFMLEGLKVSWDDIQEDINYGVKDTAYGLDAAAKAASQLVASGVKFGATYGETGNSPMAKALRGISGVAAMTNSSYEEISSIFTTVAGQGKLMTMQLRQMEARGLNAAAQMGKVMGKTEEQIREMVTKGEIDFKTFSEAMDEAFGAQAKKANETYTGALSNVKAALSRIGAELKASRIENLRKIFVTAIPVINNFKAQLMPLIEYINKLSTIVTKKLIKALQYFDPEKNAAINDSLKKVIDTSIYLLKIIKSGVGSVGKVIWNFLKNTINPFWGLVKEVGGLIGDILSSAFKGLKKGIGDSGLDILKKTLSSITVLIKALNYGVFYFRDSVLDSNVTRVFERIGSVIKKIVPFAQKLFDILIDGLGKLEPISYKIHSFFSNVFDYLDLVFNAISNGSHQLTPFVNGLIVVGKNLLQVVRFLAGLLAKDIGPFLNKLKDKAVFSVIKVVYSILRKIGNYLSSLDGFGTKLSKTVLQIYGNVKLSLTSTDSLLSRTIGLIKSVASWLWKLKDGVQYVQKPVEYIKNALKSLQPIVGAIKNAFSEVFSSIKSGFEGAFGDLVEKLKSGGPASWYFGILNFFTAISALLSTGILTRFSKVTGQIFDTLQNGKFILGRFEGTLKVIRQPFINLKYVLIGYQKEIEATRLMKIAGAIAIMAGSMILLSTIDDQELERASNGLIVVMTALITATKMITGLNLSALGPLVKSPLGQASTAMINISIAVLLMASAVKSLSKLDDKAIGKGLAGISALLGIFAIFFKTLDVKVIGTTATRIASISRSLIPFSIALNLLIIPVKVLGNMKFSELAKGLGAIGGMFLIFAGFFKLLSNNIVNTSSVRIAAIAGSLVTFALAINLLVIPIKSLGNMNTSALARGIGTVSLMLLELVVAIGVLNGMDSPGGKVVKTAASLMLLSIALGNMAIVVKMFGSMDLPALAIGLGAIAATLAILIGASVIAQKSLTGLAALSGVLIAFGIAAAGVGAGLFLISAGLAALVGVGIGGVSILVTQLGLLMTLIPVFFQQLGIGIVALLQVLTSCGDAIVQFISMLITSLAKGINQALPEIGNLIGNTLDFIMRSISEFGPKIKTIILTFLDLLLDIAYDFLPKINKFILDAVVSVLDAIDSHLPDLVDKAFTIVITFINSMADALDKHGQEIWEAIYNLIMSILEFLGFKVRDFIKAAEEWVVGMRNAIHDKINDVIQSFADIVTSVGEWLANQWETFKSWGSNIVQGLKEGLENAPIIGTIISFAKKIKNAFTGELEINSPSKVFKRYGVYIAKGLAEGLDLGKKYVRKMLDDLISMMEIKFEGNRSVLLKFFDATTKEAKDAVLSIVDAVKKLGISSNLMRGFTKNYTNDFGRSSKKAKKALSALSKELYISSDAYKEAVSNIKNYNQAIKSQQDTYADINAKIKKLQSERKKASKKRKKEIDQEIKDLKQQKNETLSNIKELSKGLKQELKNIANGPKEAYKEYRNNLKDLVEETADIISASVNDYINLFEKMEETEKVSVNELLKNMQSQVVGVSKWNDDLDKLAKRGIADGLLEKLKDMGPEGAKYVQAFLKMTKSELDQANTMFKAEGELASENLLDSMRRQMSSIKTWSKNITELSKRGLQYDFLKDLVDKGPDNADYVQALVDMTDEQLLEASQLYVKNGALPGKVADNVLAALGYALRNNAELPNGVSDNISSAVEQVLAMSFDSLLEAEALDINVAPVAEKVAEGVEEEFQKKTVKDSVQDAGFALGAALSVGIKDSKPSILSASQVIGDAAVNEFKKYFSTSNGSDISIQITNGLVTGLDGGKESVADAARELAIQAYNAMKEELGIHSPSKRMEEIGKYSDMGFAKGLLKYTSFVTSSADALGNEAYDSLKNTMTVLCDSVMDEIGQPVIRPTLDLTDINNKARSVNDLFQDGKMAIISSDTDKNIQNSPIQFVQNNYSPKALSRIDIYRDTRNQLSKLKGVVNRQ